MRDELVFILVIDCDIDKCTSSLFLSFEDNKNKRNASNDNKLWVKNLNKINHTNVI